MRVTIFLLFLMLTASSQAGSLPKDFVYISEEIPNIQLDIRYYTKDNFVAHRVTGYQAPKAIISKPAAEALKKVQKELNTFALGLKIFDSYRPQQAVDHFMRWRYEKNDLKTKDKYYPNLDKETLFKDGYIAEQSGHTRGSTLDLTIVSLHGNSSKELDMGTGWDYLDTKSWPSSVAVSAEQRANRMLLQQLMEKHGFVHFPDEWWHFTLKNEPFPNTYFNFPVK